MSVDEFEKKWRDKFGGNGWTYFCRHGDDGPVKIGFTTTSPSTRIKSLQTGNPVKLEMIAVVCGNREREWHEILKEDRIHGEWFNVDKWAWHHIKNSSFAVFI